MYRNILGKKHMQMMCHMPFWLVCLFMVYNVTFNNISDTGGPGENHRPVASHWQTLSHNVESSTPRHERKKIFTLTLRQPYGVTNTPRIFLYIRIMLRAQLGEKKGNSISNIVNIEELFYYLARQQIQKHAMRIKTKQNKTKKPVVTAPFVTK
jgi:hypothetical protein